MSFKSTRGHPWVDQQEHDYAPNQTQLATRVRRDKIRLIAILDRLEARGLLHRTPNPDDRRRFSIRSFGLVTVSPVKWG